MIVSTSTAAVAFPSRSRLTSVRGTITRCTGAGFDSNVSRPPAATSGPLTTNDPPMKLTQNLTAGGRGEEGFGNVLRGGGMEHIRLAVRSKLVMSKDWMQLMLAPHTVANSSCDRRELRISQILAALFQFHQKLKQASPNLRKAATAQTMSLSSSS